MFQRPLPNIFLWFSLLETTYCCIAAHPGVRSKGHVQVIGPNGQILVEVCFSTFFSWHARSALMLAYWQLSSGAYFGEIAMLNPNEKRTASVRALTYCDVLSLSREGKSIRHAHCSCCDRIRPIFTAFLAFEDVLEKFPRAGEAIRTVYALRLRFHQLAWFCVLYVGRTQISMSTAGCHPTHAEAASAGNYSHAAVGMP